MNELIDFGFTLWIVLIFLVGMPMLLEWLWLFYKTIIMKENKMRGKRNFGNYLQTCR